jgi:hypothetical protein
MASQVVDDFTSSVIEVTPGRISGILDVPSAYILTTGIEEEVKVPLAPSPKRTPSKRPKPQPQLNFQKQTISSQTKSEPPKSASDTPKPKKPLASKLIKLSTHSSLNQRMSEYLNIPKKRGSNVFNSIFKDICDKIINAKDLDRDRLANRF